MRGLAAGFASIAEGLASIFYPYQRPNRRRGTLNTDMRRIQADARRVRADAQALERRMRGRAF